jgi:hypothetical protein
VFVSAKPFTNTSRHYNPGIVVNVVTLIGRTKRPPIGVIIAADVETTEHISFANPENTHA